MIITRNYTIENAASRATYSAHAEGWLTQAIGAYAHAEGQSTLAQGSSSHAEGISTTIAAAGTASHAEGAYTAAPGAFGHAEGYSTVASGTNGAHAEGNSCYASGNAAHAEGQNTSASGNQSHAQGTFATADKYGQDAQGMPMGVISSARAQRSVYVAGAAVAATAGSTAELTFDGAAPVLTGAGVNVLLVPVRSAILVRYDIVARPNNNASVVAFGAGWAGSILAGRGNDTATAAAFSTSLGTVMAANTTPTNMYPNYILESGSQNNLLVQVSINTTTAATNYLRFVIVNSGTLAYSVVAVLQCTELLTNV